MPKESADINSSFGLPAILAALWAVVLLIAFLANRGSDAGQLEELIRNLGGPLVGSGFVDSFIGAIVAILIVIGWFGVGNFAASFFMTAKG